MNKTLTVELFLSDAEVKLLQKKVDKYKEAQKDYDLGQDEYTIEDEIRHIVTESQKKRMQRKSKTR